MAQLKVYSGVMYVRGRQVRALVASTAQTKVAALTGESLSRVSGYWRVTGNTSDIATATAAPETVFVSSSTATRDFVPLTAV